MNILVTIALVALLAVGITLGVWGPQKFRRGRNAGPAKPQKKDAKLATKAPAAAAPVAAAPVAAASPEPQAVLAHGLLSPLELAAAPL